jgi:hypothetical protein
MVICSSLETPVQSSTPWKNSSPAGCARVISGGSSPPFSSPMLSHQPSWRPDRRWLELLEDRNTVVRAELARFRGREVKVTGDGFLATFDGPGRAIRAARAMTQAVQPLGIEIRAGLHTGEIELSDNDIGGLTVPSPSASLWSLPPQACSSPAP